MPANVESMFYTATTADGRNGTPWHGLGTSVPDALTGAEAREAAGLDWTVRKVPMFVPALPDGSAAGPTPPTAGRVEVPGWAAVQRSSDDRIIGVVRSSYEVVQNDELDRLIDALVDDGGAKYETAGSLAGGAVVWMLARLPKTIQVPGDNGETVAYILAYTGHDGRRSLSVQPTPTRVVCQNTLNVAIAGAVSSVTVRHTAKVNTRLDEARRVLGISLSYMDTFEKVARDLVKRPMSLADVTAFTEVLIPDPAGIEPEKAVRTQKARAEIARLYTDSPNLDGVPKSAYRTLQAVAEYVDHGRTYFTTKKHSAAENRALSLLDGQGRDLKSAALALLVKA